MTEGYEIAHLDELERLPIVQGNESFVWRPVRRRFGIEAFGVNAYTGESEGDRVVEEHREQDGHEELYFVATGRAAFTLADEEVDAPAGTFVFVRPGTRRAAIAREPRTTILAIGGKRGETFSVSGWEYGFAAFAYRRLGEEERGRELMREALERYPGDWAAAYNAACYASLDGRTEEALDLLRRAVELDPEAAELARRDEDFDAMRDDARFTSAVAGQAEPGGDAP